MSRLTKTIREEMACKLVEHRYTDEAKKLVQLNRELAERVYAHCYPTNVREAMDTVRKAFPSAFETREGIRVNAGGFNVTIGERIHSRWVKIEQVAPVRYRLVDTYSRHDISGDAKLTEDVKAFAIQSEGFNDVCATAYSEAMSVLNTMATGKKLAEAWPEAMEVIGSLIPEDQRTLPVVQVSAINAKFKLPPKAHAEGGK